MLFDVELYCDKWKGCKTKWCNGDGGFWCNEDCKLLQVRPITRKRKVEKILSNSDAVYVLYADGTWRKKDGERMISLISLRLYQGTQSTLMTRLSK